MKAKFETLIIENDVKYRERWTPKIIESYKKVLIVDDQYLLSEICYTLQYIEFISFELESLNLQSVVRKLKIKSFVISSMSIIEGLLSDYLKRTGHYSKNSWYSIEKYESNSKKNSDNVEIKTIVDILEKGDEEYKMMTLDSMIQKISNNKSIKIKDINTKTLKELKMLRNKVHLTATTSNLETSYMSFDEDVLSVVKRMLRTFLIAEEFCKDDELAKDRFDYLS